MGNQFAFLHDLETDSIVLLEMCIVFVFFFNGRCRRVYLVGHRDVSAAARCVHGGNVITTSE